MASSLEPRPKPDLSLRTQSIQLQSLPESNTCQAARLQPLSFHPPHLDEAKEARTRCRCRDSVVEVLANEPKSEIQRLPLLTCLETQILVYGQAKLYKQSNDRLSAFRNTQTPSMRRHRANPANRNGTRMSVYMYV